MEKLTSFFKSEKAQPFFENAGEVLLIVVLAFTGWRIIRYLLNVWRKKLEAKSLESTHQEEDHKRINTLVGLLTTGLRIAVFTVAILMILQTLGVQIGPLLASAGILGLAVGFGAQNLVQDVISGFFILLEDQVRTGDVATINGTGGVVERINFRTIILRDLSGTVHYFRNGSINNLSNLTKVWSAALFDIGVAYKEDVDRVIAVMKEVFTKLRSQEEMGHFIIEDIEIFGLDEFADSSVIIKSRIKTLPGKQWSVKREYKRLLKIAFDEKGIEIPFPHQSLYFGEASKPLEVKLSEKTN